MGSQRKRTSRGARAASGAQWSSEAQRTKALLTLANDRQSYIANGQIREKTHRASSAWEDRGPIVPWNQAARTEFGSAERAVAFAKKWLASPAGRQADALEHLDRFVTRSAISQEVRRRIASGNLEPPTLEARAAKETPAQTAARTTRDKARYDAWHMSAGRSYPEPAVTAGSRYGRHAAGESPGYHRSSRLSDRETAARNRYWRSADAAFRKSTTPKIERGITTTLKAAARTGEVVDLKALRDTLMAKYVKPSTAQGIGRAELYRQEGMRPSDQLSLAHWRAVYDAVAKGIFAAAKNHDVTIWRDVPHAERGGYRGHLVEATNTDRRASASAALARAARNNGSFHYSAGLRLEGPSDNPSFVRMVAHDGQDIGRTGERHILVTADGIDLGRIQIGKAWTAADRANAPAQIHAERAAANPVYRALTDLQPITVRRSESRTVNDQYGIGHQQWRNVNVKMTPTHWDGATLSVQEKITGQPVKTATYTAEQLDTLGNGNHWSIVSPAPRTGTGDALRLIRSA